MLLDVLSEEFGDLDPDVLTRVIARIAAAAMLGAMLGLNREIAGKPAGLRTHMLVAVGSALFVLVPLLAGMQIKDVSRIIQGVVTGIGFLGAGAILKRNDEQEIHGLTTAASIWLTSAIGLAAGLGRLGIAVVGAVTALIILWAVEKLERWAGS
jgi:putative Mg2+ transporter-C (MgtC) family protein